MFNVKKTRRRRKQAEERRLKVVEQERSVKEDIEKSEDKRNRKFNRSSVPRHRNKDSFGIFWSI